MIKSMTGFGKAICKYKSQNILLEIRTLNAKQLDISIKPLTLNGRLNNLYKEKEPEIRSIIAKELERGKIEIFIYLDNKEQSSDININKSLLKKYYEDLKGISKELKNKFPTDYFALALKMPDVICTSAESPPAEEWKTFENTLKKSLQEVNEFRLKEGSVLEKDITKRIKLILSLLQKIPFLEKGRIKAIKERIKKNIEEFIDKEKINQSRFEEELIYYLEKIDITEEKVRLKKHCDYFQEVIKQSDANGRKLGFISQEIGREINTIGSKANDADMQKIVVQMKDELEKIKEQLLNVL